MAVNALELRPRGTLALFDAAIRLCTTTSGVWAITLPFGAALVATLINLAEAMRLNEPLLWPVIWWTFAWAARAIGQGAASVYVEQELLGTEEPSVRTALVAALKRAPGLVIASTMLLLINVAIATLTLGIGFFFVGAHAAGYAAIMRGEGSALNVYGTAAKLLGPARTTATWVRLAGLTQLILAVNLHAAVAVALMLLSHVMGFDVTFLDRFASLDHATWVATLAITTFALFEPIRAAVGALLLIDGRVRQQGLDLMAAAEQLPRRRRSLSGSSLRGAAIVLACTVATRASAGATLGERLQAVRASCEMESIDRAALAPFDTLGEADQSALSRFVSTVETAAYDDEDCELAEQYLHRAVGLLPQSAQAQLDDPRQAAAHILQRPEFQPAVDRPSEVEQEDPEAPPPNTVARWWHDLLRSLFQWLKKLLEKDHDTPQPSREPSTPMVGANLVMAVVVAAVILVLGYLLVRGKASDAGDELDGSDSLSEVPLSDNPASALSRAPESWAGLADELARRGEYREAIRHLYLALLSRLHRNGVIDYDPTLSNWEYLRAFKGPGNERTAFRELTRRFDFAWYGHLETTATAWSRFRSVAEPLLNTGSVHHA